MNRDAVAERLGRNLGVARRRVGYSQAELGALCSLHRTEIGLVEKGGRIPRADTLVKFVRVLDVSADDLLDGIDWTIPAPTRPGGFAVEPPATVAATPKIIPDALR
jgi:transcriptional regulator with XRE-family HTH domain